MEFDVEELDIDERLELEAVMYGMLHHSLGEYNPNVFLYKKPEAKKDSETSDLPPGMYIDTIGQRDISNEDVISINSTDSEEDDVVEIKRETPAVICIDSDDSDDERKRKKPFINRNGAQLDRRPAANGNLPTMHLLERSFSPVSAASDDFIQKDCENIDRSESSFRFNTFHPELNLSSSTQISNYIAGGELSSDGSELPANHDIFVHSDVRIPSSMESGSMDGTSTDFRAAEIASGRLQVSIVRPQSSWGDTSTPIRESLGPIRQSKASLRQRITCNSEPKSIAKSRAEMQGFYNDSWGGEKFNHNQIISKMSRAADKWPINSSDRSRQQYSKSPGWKAVRCHNCHHMGHMAQHCREPKSVIKCYMCGEQGHKEPRCPNKLCLRCGTPATSFLIGCQNCKHSASCKCSLCGMTGHNQRHCPDLWRRYHKSIDSAKSPVESPKTLKHTRSLFCSNCSMRGHLYHNCIKFKFSEHSLLLPNIVEYSSVYPLEDNTKLGQQNTSILCESQNINRTEVEKQVEVSAANLLAKGARSTQNAFLTSLNDFEAIPSDDSSETVENIQGLTNVNSVEQVNYIVEQAPSDGMMQDNNVTSSEDDVSCVMLDKDTLKVMMKQTGAEFLENMSKMLKIQIKIDFATIGGAALVLTGQKSQHETFKLNLKSFIKEINQKLIDSCTTACNLPRKITALLNILQSEVRALRGKFDNLNYLYNTSKQVGDEAASILSEKKIKLYNKKLRKLNMFLYGRMGYEDGRMHMEKLAVNITELEIYATSIEFTPTDLYDEIKSHYDYIFAPIRHGNYEELIKKFYAERFIAQKEFDLKYNKEKYFTDFATKNNFEAPISQKFENMLKVTASIIAERNCNKGLKRKLTRKLKPFLKKRDLKNMNKYDLVSLQKFTKTVQDL